jgi:hypothetical protein
MTCTPRTVGSAALDGGAGCYRRTRDYGSRHDGMSLGTAMTVSGAAVSPNMGYHSSPALSVLMTFFNVRLGAWLGNPGPDGARVLHLEGPRFSALPLVQEALDLPLRTAAMSICRTVAISKISVSMKWCVDAAVTSSSATPAAIPA